MRTEAQRGKIVHPLDEMLELVTNRFPNLLINLISTPYGISSLIEHGAALYPPLHQRRAATC